MTLPLSVDLWQLNLCDPPFTLEQALAQLTDTERQRAQRYQFDIKRREFAFTRAALRHCLGHYLQTNAVLTVTAQGKPILRDHALAFNVSHSGELALLAFTMLPTVGVDVEQVVAKPHCLKLAKRFFSPREFEAIQALPPNLHERAFFATWTRKESFIKAQASSIGAGLDQFDVSVHPDQPPALLRSNDDQSWRLYDLALPAGYVGAITCPEAVTLTHRQF